jgi:hypothetical protein
MDWMLDLLTTLTHHSELQAITALSLISTIQPFSSPLSSPAAPWQRLLIWEVLQLPTLMSFLHLLSYRTAGQLSPPEFSIQFTAASANCQLSLCYLFSIILPTANCGDSLNYFRLPILDYCSVGLGSSLYILGADQTGNTISIVISQNVSIAACVFVFSGKALPSRCLVVDVC